MFGHEKNLKGLMYLVLLDRRVKKISLLSSFWKSFIFLVLVPYFLNQKVFKRDFWEISFLSLYVFPVLANQIYNIQINSFMANASMTWFLFKSHRGDKTILTKFKNVSNYGEFICNIFCWNTVKWKPALVSWFQKMGWSRVSVCASVGNLLLVKCNQRLSNCINKSVWDLSREHGKVQ